MRVIRAFEERSLAEFSAGRLFGTTHTYIGQEANAAAIFPNLTDYDVIWSNHRCHGHFIAYGGDPYRLAAELMGKATGLVSGRGGSQHIHWKNFYTNGIQGGIVPIAAGMALAKKFDQSNAIAVVFIGDGTLGEGAVYESLNIAALWKLPLLVVVENNRYAQTTPIDLALSGKIADRFSAFGIPVDELDTSDVTEIEPVASRSINAIRQGNGPRALVLNTYRFSAHSKGDDTRDREHVAMLRAKFDPLKILGNKMSTEEISAEDAAAIELIDQSFTKAFADPFPTDLGLEAAV